jgi:hypothetical protein
MDKLNEIMEGSSEVHVIEKAEDRDENSDPILPDPYRNLAVRVANDQEFIMTKLVEFGSMLEKFLGIVSNLDRRVTEMLGRPINLNLHIDSPAPMRADTSQSEQPINPLPPLNAATKAALQGPTREEKLAALTPNEQVIWDKATKPFGLFEAFAWINHGPYSKDNPAHKPVLLDQVKPALKSMVDRGILRGDEDAGFDSYNQPNKYKRAI